VEAGFAGFGVGALLYAFVIASVLPFLYSLSLTSSSSSAAKAAAVAESEPLLTSSIAEVPKSLPSLPPPPPKVLSRKELKSLRNAVKRATVVVLDLRTQTMEAAAEAENALLVETSDSTLIDTTTTEGALAAECVGVGIASSSSPIFWDRVDFLRESAESTTHLSKILDDYLADLFVGSKAAFHLTCALKDLYTRAALPAVTSANEAREEMFKAINGLNVLSPSASLNTTTSVLSTSSNSSDLMFLTQNFTRAAMTGDFIEKEIAINTSKRIVDEWVSALTSSSSSSDNGISVATALPILNSKPARLALEKLVFTHSQLTIWPLAANANIEWVISSSSSPSLPLSSTPLVDEKHSLFSMTGEGVKEGTLVYIVGPSLQARTPITSDSLSGNIDNTIATDIQITELRGRRCRSVVVACDK
jgi:hypothetical protein